MPISISIVEDNDKLRGTLAKVIGRADGFRFATDYANAEEAIADLPKVWPDVVLMDINLPGMNGVELARAIFSNPATAHIPVAVISAEPSIHRLLELRRAGVRGYVRKPCTPESLRDLVAPLLETIHA